MAIDVGKKIPMPAYDTVEITYPTAASELYTYKRAGTTVATATVTYTDSTKASLSSFVRSWDV